MAFDPLDPLRRDADRIRKALSSGRRFRIGEKNVVGTRVREARKARGSTQGELAQRLQARGLPWDQTAISLVESHQHEVLDSEVVILAHALGVPLSQLFSGGQ